MQVEARARAVVEEATQQRQGLRQGTYVADDDTELAFLAERELRGMIFEAAQIVQKNAHVDGMSGRPPSARRGSHCGRATSAPIDLRGFSPPPKSRAGCGEASARPLEIYPRSQPRRSTRVDEVLPS